MSSVLPLRLPRHWPTDEDHTYVCESDFEGRLERVCNPSLTPNEKKTAGIGKLILGIAYGALVVH
jgi:hypothetical protein